MPRQRFSPEQIIVKLREAEIEETKGRTQIEAAKKLGIFFLQPLKSLGLVYP